jgi:hypothetical protein
MVTRVSVCHHRVDTAVARHGDAARSKPPKILGPVAFATALAQAGRRRAGVPTAAHPGSARAFVVTPGRRLVPRRRRPGAAHASGDEDPGCVRSRPGRSQGVVRSGGTAGTSVALSMSAGVSRNASG